MKYKVYVMTPGVCYGGFALIAAENAKEANEMIQRRRNVDLNNECNSWGFTSVEEYDALDSVFSEEEGIVYNGVYYTGWC